MKVLGMVVMLATLCPGPGWAAGGSLLHCQALDWAGLADDGRLERSEGLGLRAFWDDFIVDLLTGVIRYGDVVAFNRRVVQPGDGGNDTVIVLGSAATVFKNPILRVRQWDGLAGTTFVVNDLGAVVTGTCRDVIE